MTFTNEDALRIAKEAGTTIQCSAVDEWLEFEYMAFQRALNLAAAEALEQMFSLDYGASVKLIKEYRAAATEAK